MSENKSFDFEIIHTNRNKLLKVDWIEVQSPTGDFLVGFEHEPIVSILKDRSQLRYKSSETKIIEEIDIYGGIFKVQNNKATVILDL